MKDEAPIDGGEVAPAIKAILEPEQPVVEQPAVEAETVAGQPAIPAPPDQSSPPTELPPSRGDYGWLTTSFDPNDLPDEMPTIVAPPVSGPPPVRVPLAETASAPVNLQPVAVPVPSAPEQETEPEPEPVAVEPDAKPVPFWKKELSLGGGA